MPILIVSMKDILIMILPMILLRRGTYFSTRENEAEWRVPPDDEGAYVLRPGLGPNSTLDRSNVHKHNLDR